jgi:hypothetical protein
MRFAVGTLEGRRRWRFWRGTAAAIFFAVRDQLPRQSLRHETAGRGARDFGERRGLAAGGFAPLDFLIPDQFFDRTLPARLRFFGGGIVAHVGFDHPTCAQLAGCWATACEEAGVKAHRGGTYVCIEGPQFSTLAEAHVHRQLRFEIVGMTNVTEAKLAREAELCYATVAMITDYDCWHPQHSSVTVAEIIANLNRNTGNAQNVLRAAVRRCPRSAPAVAGRRWPRDSYGSQENSRGGAAAPGGIVAGKYI